MATGVYPENMDFFTDRFSELSELVNVVMFWVGERRFKVEVYEQFEEHLAYRFTTLTYELVDIEGGGQIWKRLSEMPNDTANTEEKALTAELRWIEDRFCE